MTYTLITQYKREIPVKAHFCDIDEARELFLRFVSRLDEDKAKGFAILHSANDGVMSQVFYH